LATPQIAGRLYSERAVVAQAAPRRQAGPHRVFRAARRSSTAEAKIAARTGLRRPMAGDMNPPHHG